MHILKRPKSLKEDIKIYKERLEDLSIYYWLQDLFSDTAYVTIKDGFPEEGLVIPTVSVEADVINIAPLELGNYQGVNDRTWYINVFAVNKSQRDEFAYRIINEIQKGIPVYDYNEGFPPSVTPAQIGKLDVQQIHMEVIKIMPELVDTFYYRAEITFLTINNRI